MPREHFFADGPFKVKLLNEEEGTTYSLGVNYVDEDSFETEGVINPGFLNNLFYAIKQGFDNPFPLDFMAQFFNLHLKEDLLLVDLPIDNDDWQVFPDSISPVHTLIKFLCRSGKRENGSNYLRVNPEAKDEVKDQGFFERNIQSSEKRLDGKTAVLFGLTFSQKNKDAIEICKKRLLEQGAAKVFCVCLFSETLPNEYEFRKFSIYLNQAYREFFGMLLDNAMFLYDETRDMWWDKGTSDIPGQEYAKYFGIDIASAAFKKTLYLLKFDDIDTLHGPMDYWKFDKGSTLFKNNKYSSVLKEMFQITHSQVIENSDLDKTKPVDPWLLKSMIEYFDLADEIMPNLAGSRRLQLTEYRELEELRELAATAKNEMHRRDKKNYRQRLLLGTGNSSFPRALVEKHAMTHPRLASALIVTEYMTKKALKASCTGEDDDNGYCNFRQNYKFLLNKGAQYAFGIDATKLHKRYKGKRFERIHFNCPYPERQPGETPAQNKAKNKALVANFFASASQVQQAGDRIYMALATGFKKNPVWYESTTYGVAECCKKYGYAFIKKRNFVDPIKGNRYPGYSHIQTGQGFSVSTASSSREFVFEKKVPGKDYPASAVKRQGSVYKNWFTVLPERVTDSESSTYLYSSAEEKQESKHESKSALAFGPKENETPITVRGEALVRVECGSEGACLFNVFDHQLNEVESADMLRKELIDWYQTALGRTFLETHGAIDSELRIEEKGKQKGKGYRLEKITSVDHYIEVMSKTETWGTELEIQSLSEQLKRTIILVSNDEANTTKVYGAEHGGKALGVYYFTNLHFQALVGEGLDNLIAEEAVLEPEGN